MRAALFLIVGPAASTSYSAQPCDPKEGYPSCIDSSCGYSSPRSSWPYRQGLYAQEATISGTITDSTGGRAARRDRHGHNIDSGNTFVGVTDGPGRFLMAVRIGPTITANCKVSDRGFAPACRYSRGQAAAIALQLAPSTVQETVTVTGEAPLIDLNSLHRLRQRRQKQMSELRSTAGSWLD